MDKQEFIEKMNEMYPDFDFSKAEFEKVTDYVEIICKKHGSFKRKVYNCLKGNVRCPDCFLEERRNSFLETAHKIHGDRYDYSQIEYVNKTTPIKIICKEHGPFMQTPETHRDGYGCSLCSGKRKPTTEEWVDSVKHLYDGRYDLSKVQYIDNKTPVEVVCSKHGSFYPIPNNYRKGISGCPRCNDELKHERYSSNTKEFIEKACKVHGDRYDYSKVDYYNKSRGVLIICKEHGEFEQAPSVHLSGSGCPKCKNKSQTILFEKLQSIFVNEKIEYEKRFKWLGLQSLDIYFPKYSIGIEYDGIQHFEPVEHFGGEKYFEIIKIRDAKKDKLCLDNGCTLIRLKYDYKDEDFNNLVKQIQDIIDRNKTLT